MVFGHVERDLQHLRAIAGHFSRRTHLVEAKGHNFLVCGQTEGFVGREHTCEASALTLGLVQLLDGCLHISAAPKVHNLVAARLRIHGKIASARNEKVRERCSRRGLKGICAGKEGREGSAKKKPTWSSDSTSSDSGPSINIPIESAADPMLLNMPAAISRSRPCLAEKI